MPRFCRSCSLLAVAGLLLITTWLYAPALDFGFIWDDPLWFGRVIGQSVPDLIKPTPDYHFYRPALLLYVRLFLKSNDTLDAPLMHAAQIGWHLINVALSFALCRRLRLDGWAAAAVAALVAWYPFSQQAVAWAAPAQPAATTLQNGAWLTYLQARRQQRRPRLMAGLSLSLFVIALFVQEGTAALAGLPLLLEWVLRQDSADAPSGSRSIWLLALAYLLITAGFGLLWLVLPRQPGYTSWVFEKAVLAYLLQGFIYPLLGRPAGYDPAKSPSPELLLTLTGIVIGGLLIAARRARQGRQALFGLAWASLGVMPAAVGLDYDYVKLSSRLLHYAAPGVAILWVCALLPPAGPTLSRRLARVGGAVLLGLMAIQSVVLLVDLQKMYVGGAHLLAQEVQVAQTEGEQARLLFVNFPDRYMLKRPPYPLGHWGVVLAPVVLDLGAFPDSLTGHHPNTASRSMPWLDAQARDAGPYHINLRGVITPPDQLYQLAKDMDAVYLSRHFPDGSFALEWAGSVTSDPSPDCQLAAWGQTLCLEAAQIEAETDQLRLILTWHSLSPAQLHDTIFVHLGQAGLPPIAQADGAAWLGTLPLTAWQPGDTIREQRIIPLPHTIPPGRHAIRVGVYNRVTGERLPATTVLGERLPDDALIVGHPPQ